MNKNFSTTKFTINRALHFIQNGLHLIVRVLTINILIILLLYEIFIHGRGESLFHKNILRLNISRQ